MSANRPIGELSVFYLTFACLVALIIGLGLLARIAEPWEITWLSSDVISVTGHVLPSGTCVARRKKVGRWVFREPTAEELRHAEAMWAMR